MLAYDHRILIYPDFGNRPGGEFTGELKGLIAAAYSLGAVLSLPFIGVINEKLGRRWSIFGGSAIMVAGSIIQGFSVNGESTHSESLKPIANQRQLACISPLESCLALAFRRVLCLDLPSSASSATPRSVHISPAFSTSHFTLV